jgi:hypothetical protein
MAWGVRWYLVGSILGVLGVLAGCSGGNMFAEREPWRHDAEVQCINSGQIREGPGVVRVKAIRGPGVCGADFPLKVSILGDGSPLGYTDDLRPPATIPARPGTVPSRWPIKPGEAAVTTQELSSPPGGHSSRPMPAGARPAPVAPSPPGSSDPVSLTAPSGTERPPAFDFRGPFGGARQPIAPAGSPRDDFSPVPYERRALIDAPPRDGGTSRSSPGEAAISSRAAMREVAAPEMARRGPQVRSGYPGGPAAGVLASPAPVSVSPAATLACPIVSALDQWIASSVQPAAMRWFGLPVAEITQISAYSCRGMNGDPRARISEHAFGNALDISAFMLADGRKITVKAGWNGLPEEQGFLRDIQAAACDQFTTVLAPGSNVYHYDHIHVDLMRRSSGHRACNPHAVSGEEVAARASGRYAARRPEPAATGSLAQPRPPSKRLRYEPDDSGRFVPALPMAEPGNDGED